MTTDAMPVEELAHWRAVLSREEILSEAWGSDALGARVVDAHVKNIRRKLGEAGRRVETVRGIGYRFRER